MNGLLRLASQPTTIIVLIVVLGISYIVLANRRHKDRDHRGGIPD